MRRTYAVRRTLMLGGVHGEIENQLDQANRIGLRACLYSPVAGACPSTIRSRAYLVLHRNRTGEACHTILYKVTLSRGGPDEAIIWYNVQ